MSLEHAPQREAGTLARSAQPFLEPSRKSRSLPADRSPRWRKTEYMAAALLTRSWAGLFRYRPSDVREWLGARVRRSTSDPGGEGSER
jgi:hypothetical protein